MAGEMKEVELQLIYDVTSCEISNIFRGKDKSELGEDKEVTLVGFKTVKDTLTFVNGLDSIFSFRPIFRFPCGSEITTVGKNAGISLDNFIPLQTKKLLCEFDGIKYLRMNKKFREFFKQMATMLYSLHSRGSYVGDNFRSCVFVNTICSRFYITLVGHKQLSGVEDGIWFDLCEFKKMIVDIVNSNTNVRNLPQEDMVDLRMFLDLFPEYPPSSLAELRDLSYFVCHAPLFWSYEQRYSFCYSFYQLRKPDVSLFDSIVEFHEYAVMKNWRKNITDPDLKLVLQHSPKLQSGVEEYSSRKGLIPFHRCTLVHHNANLRKQQQSTSSSLPSQHDIDMKLLKLFPYALPIAYTVLYKKLYRFLGDTVVEHFRCGPAGLDYSDPVAVRRQ